MGQQLQIVQVFLGKMGVLAGNREKQLHVLQFIAPFGRDFVKTTVLIAVVGATLNARTGLDNKVTAAAGATANAWAAAVVKATAAAEATAAVGLKQQPLECNRSRGSNIVVGITAAVGAVLAVGAAPKVGAATSVGATAAARGNRSAYEGHDRPPAGRDEPARQPAIS